MTDLSARLSIGFSYVGHTFMHVLAALYLTVVLALVPAWHLSYDQLIGVWTVGSLLIGVGAPLAGWLGDRWSDARMMVAFFWLTGGGAIAAGFADRPAMLTLALALLGLGASIYHPVGMSWLVKNAADRGRALGYQGVFGSVGVATAALVAGTLTDVISWQAAFIVPGALCVATGCALAACVATGVVRDRPVDVRPQPRPSQGDAVRAFLVLSVTMATSGLVWNAMTVAMPKWFDDRLGALAGGGTLGIGGLVTLIYLIGALPQLWGGRLADRVSPKSLYIACLMLQVPLLGMGIVLAGASVPVLAALIVSCQNLVIPIENLLLARFTPDRHRGLAYGAKFILTFGVGPLAVQLVAHSYRLHGGFGGLFAVLAALAATACLAALLLPRDRSPVVASPLPDPAAAA